MLHFSLQRYISVIILVKDATSYMRTGNLSHSYKLLLVVAAIRQLARLVLLLVVQTRVFEHWGSIYIRDIYGQDRPGLAGFYANFCR